jgi:hypothetical protein
MSALAHTRRRLLAAQQPDGGFGPLPGRVSRTEETALAALALAGARDADAAARRALGWLAEAQRADGSWPVGADVPEPSWASALAVLALVRLHGDDGSALAGARWLVAQEARRASWLARLIQTHRSQRLIDQDPNLRGWPWTTGASSWVEPTAYALLALRSFAPKLPRGARARIEEGERLVYDRMCPGGGWNYGNSVVLDEALEPYPDTTAIALLALRQHADAEANQRSLDVLERLLAEHDSGLALSWSILCLDVYGRETQPLRTRLEASFAARGFLDDTRSLALACLALDDGARHLGDPA